VPRRWIVSRVLVPKPPCSHSTLYFIMYNHSPTDQHAMPQGYDAGTYQQPGQTSYGGIGFGLGGHDMGGRGQGQGMGNMSMMGMPMGGMGGMGMGGNMMGGGAMGPGGGMGGMGSMSRGMAFGQPQQAHPMMGGMGHMGQMSGMGQMGGMGQMSGMGMGAMGQSGFVEVPFIPWKFGILSLPITHSPHVYPTWQ
jgi:hypothetical protein